MAHSPHRRWKGCQMCKPWKNRSHGDTERAPWAVRRQVGKARRWNRHDTD